MKKINAKKALSSVLTFAIWSVGFLMSPGVAGAAKFTDGTWTGTDNGDSDVTITFVTTGALDQDDEIILTFTSATSDIDATGTNIAVAGSTSGAMTNETRSNNDTSDAITITLGATDSIGGGETVTITMSDALDGYVATTYAQESVAITTMDEGSTPQDYGLAMITNDNTTMSNKTDVTASVPLFLNMSVDTNSINLGTLTTASVSEQDQTYIVNSNNTSGVQIQMTSDGGLVSGTNDINAVSDGTVSAASEEYGISVDNLSGLTAESPFDSGDDAIPTSATDLVESTTTVNSGTFDINYKASISGSTTAGSYTQEVTVTATTKA